MESGERALVVVVRDATAGDAGLQATEAARRATGVALGAAELALQILRAILDRSGPSRPDAHAPRSSELPDALHQLPGAALGLGLELQRRSLDVAAALGATLWPSLRVVAGPVVTVAGVPLGAEASASAACTAESSFVSCSMRAVISLPESSTIKIV